MPSAHAGCLRGQGPLVLKRLLREREGLEGFARFALADGGEVEVDEGGLEATMAACLAVASA